MRRSVLTVAVLAVVLAVGVPSLARADRGGGHGHGHHNRDQGYDDHDDDGWHGRDRDRDQDRYYGPRFRTDDFTLIFNWHHDHDGAVWYGRPLPPGLERQLRMRGHCPPGMVIRTLPPVLVERLGPPPRGYDRFVIGRDVVMVELASGTIADIIRNVF